MANAALLSPLKAPSKVMGMDFTPSPAMFPGLMSVKHNGMRGCAIQGVWRSYNMEEVRMAPHIKAMFQDILDYANEHNLVFDGEFNSSTLNKVGQTMSVLAGTRPCPDDFQFKCFFEVPYSVWNLGVQVKMGDLTSVARHYLENFYAVPQTSVSSWKEFEQIAEENRGSNLEGFMLLNPRAYWRHKRSTIGQGILFKYKYYSDPIDAKILDIMPRKQLKKGLSSGINPTGYAKRLHTQASYEETAIGGVLCCMQEDGTPVSVPFPVGTSLAERAMYYAEFKGGGEFDLRDKWVQFRKLSVEDGSGSISIKDVEFRDSKD